jgi:L-alanine-DL-glutamate epimerase-like enolase superfamily enzyme
VRQATRDVLAAGFTRIKLHEITLPAISACREVAGSDVDICVDVNCAWSEEFIRDNLDALRALNLTWLEEPIYPPEDFAALAAVRRLGLPIAAGENWCTAFQMEAGMRAGAVDYYQPSLTKVGGVSEYLAIAEAALRLGARLMPHSPYFGPGYFASLQVAAARPQIEALEYNFVKPAAWLADVGGIRRGGFVTVSERPGIGFEPDPAVLARYTRQAGERIQ